MSPIIEILFEDSCLLVLNKPCLIHSVRSPRSKSDSVADFLADRSELFHAASEKPGDMGLVNRLDFETSGLLVAAKSRAVWEHLHEQLTGGSARKQYLALLDGSIERSLEADNFIGARSRGAKKVAVSPRKKPRYLAACTRFDPLRTVAGCATCVKISTESGRRHQVRAHAAYIGHPLSGDTLYGSKTKLAAILRRPEAELPPFFLHALEMTVRHPKTVRSCTFRAPLPAYAGELNVD